MNDANLPERVRERVEQEERTAAALDRASAALAPAEPEPEREDRIAAFTART